MKNITKNVVLMSLIVCILLSVVSCNLLFVPMEKTTNDEITGTTTPEEDTPDNLYTLEMQTVFEMARNAGYTGTLEELIAMFRGETGPAGKDGVTPHIGANGNWWVGDTDLGVLAQGPQGEQGIQGEKGDQGEQGVQGEPGRGILKMEIVNGELIVYYTDGMSQNLGPIVNTDPDLPETTPPEETTPEVPPTDSAYEAWIKYFEAMQKYEQQFPAYMEYVSYHQQYQAAVDKLAMFESIFQADSRGWCMYNDIMGPAVTEVLSKQDLLISSGANADDVHLAGQATENLRVLLKGYNDLRNKAEWSSDHEKYKALYTYYTENYDALEQNFVDLYKTLKGLYENSVVSSYLGVQGKAEHYRQLVGHLFVVATSLDASSQRNESSWQMDQKKLLDVIEEVHYFEDGDWDPRTTAFPTVEVPYVEEPVKPVEPSVPYPIT